ncbi:hypothetical protein K8R33_03710 [archaeon]|nr:hypothetical protein [archaeon]
MLNKRGSLDLAEAFGVFLVFAFLLLIFLVFIIPGVTKDKDEEIAVKEALYAKENIFVLNNYLNTPVEVGDVSDLINLFLVDSSYEDKLVSVTNNLFSAVYGDCYYLDLGNLEFGSGNNGKSICIPYPGKDDLIQICLDISEYEEKGVEKCL